MLSRNLKSGALLFLAVLFLSFIVKYNFLVSAKEDEVEANAEKIQAILADNFDQTEKILVAIGQRIINDAPSLKPEEIHKIFSDTPNINGYNNIFSWSLFDWVNMAGYQIVNTVIGVRKNPPQIALERNYLNHGNEPWKISFSNGDIGNPSGVYIVPVAVQVSSKEKRRIGAISVGIDVKKLATLVESRIDKNINFLLIDQRSNEVTCGLRDSEKHFGVIMNRMPNSLDGINYIFEKRMDPQYPYKIWVGYDKKEFWREVRYATLMLAIQIIGVAACVAFLLKRADDGESGK